MLGAAEAEPSSCRSPRSSLHSDPIPYSPPPVVARNIPLFTASTLNIPLFARFGVLTCTKPSGHQSPLCKSSKSAPELPPGFCRSCCARCG